MSTTKNHSLNTGRKRKPAFTLAEVLITLVIIGVIAAATIPTLLQKHFEQEMITKLKKNYSVLNNAYAQAIRENGTPDGWNLGDAASYEGAEIIYNNIKPYLKIQKECGGSGKCFGNIKGLYGQSVNLNPQSYNYVYKVILDDGTSLGFYNHMGEEHCKNYTSCGLIFIDLNNLKGPNRYGLDVFQFNIRKTNIQPHIRAGKPINYLCMYGDKTSTGNGDNCTGHVIQKGNMNYLRHDIIDEWQ